MSGEEHKSNWNTTLEFSLADGRNVVVNYNPSRFVGTWPNVSIEPLRYQVVVDGDVVAERTYCSVLSWNSDVLKELATKAVIEWDTRRTQERLYDRA
jgi:hypothetical protein